MKTYKDVYELPLTHRHICRVHDNKGQFVFQFEPLESDLTIAQILILETINGYISSPFINDNIKYNKQDGHIYGNDKVIITIRGWGNLTGIGGHNLSLEEAANIQDTFAEFIVQKLSGK